MVGSFKEPSWVPKERRDMKRVVVDHYGGPEVLQVVEEDDPRPGPGEVRVRVLAAGVSFSDALLRAGVYLGGPKPPFTPGYELVGVVEELGPGCSRLREGQPPPGVVPGGLPRVAGAASPRRDPPGRVRAPATHRSPPRARAARELGGHRKARTRALTGPVCGVPAGGPKERL